MVGKSRSGFSVLGLWDGGLPQGASAIFLEVSSRRRYRGGLSGGLLWGFWGAPITDPMSPEAEIDVDFDEFLEYLGRTSIADEEEEFEDFVEHLDNQQW